MTTTITVPTPTYIEIYQVSLALLPELRFMATDG